MEKPVCQEEPGEGWLPALARKTELTQQDLEPAQPLESETVGHQASNVQVTTYTFGLARCQDCRSWQQ